MIIYVGDWIKMAGEWRQVVSVNGDMYALINADSLLDWFDANNFIDPANHMAHSAMQKKLNNAGI